MKTLHAKVTVVPLQCTACKRYHEIGVRLVSEGCSEWCNHPAPHDEPDLEFELPDNCACGEPLDNPTNIRDVQDAALYIFAHGYPESAA